MVLIIFMVVITWFWNQKKLSLHKESRWTAAEKIDGLMEREIQLPARLHGGNIGSQLIIYRSITGAGLWCRLCTSKLTRALGVDFRLESRAVVSRPVTFGSEQQNTQVIHFTLKVGKLSLSGTVSADKCCQHSCQLVGQGLVHSRHKVVNRNIHSINLVPQDLQFMTQGKTKVTNDHTT